ncbi:solute carrier family 15 member 4-like [Plakobranchus ocellatus]|uniref:Solute carrier family 15 member 4-like n=1 Tax=Plakobranchus ocellatus TaxID=259542 RepID=A0AAV3ZNF7_9GAST|nr:solute carrier family 15 member 4-like [Plakobranchus ocellatus]
MLQADQVESEKSPLLKKKFSRSLTVSNGEDENFQEQDAASDAIKFKVSSMDSERMGVVLCVLLVELCERLAYFSVSSNLVLFCTSVLDLTSTQATTVSLIFTGTVYIIPIMGGYIADACSNRFNVIYGSGLIYLCGLFLLLCAAPNYSDLFGSDVADLSLRSRRVSYIGGLGLVAIGTGGIKSNVGPFGAQQVEDLGRDAVQVFFNWFYWFINVGGLIAFTGVAYVEQNVSFSIGYLVPLIALVLALIFLNVARRRYIHKDAQGSIFVTFLRICGEACCRQSPFIDGRRQKFDSARREYGGSFDSDLVDGVLAVIKILPIFFFIIMFWVIYSQMQSTYFIQGERMDLTIGNTQIPVAMLNAVNTIAVLLTIPVLDRLVYPFFKRIGHPLNHLQRIGIGFVLCACSVFVAGGVEIYRKKKLGFDQQVGEEVVYAANVTVFLQIPQFVLIGAGEAFTSISGLEFSYTQSPSYMQGAVMGLFLATTGLGSYLSTAIIAVVGVATKEDPWFPDEINDGKVEYLFFLFGILMIIFFLTYLPVAYKYKYQPFLYDDSAAGPGLRWKNDDKSKDITFENSVTIL